ncbi:MAG: phosphoribosyl-AMP cyclohydrolase [bacterium]
MHTRNINKFIRMVAFDTHGLVPAVIQDAKDNTVLMAAYMNKQSLRVSLKEGKTCFWSRSRKTLWRKGETSGNRQIIKAIHIDCDGDCILFKVRQIGNAACHTGYHSCFFKQTGKTGALKVSGKKIFDPKKVYRTK